MNGAKDPDEFIKKFGAQRFKMLLENSDGAINFELEKCRTGLDLNSETDKVTFLKRSVKVLSGISNRLERDVYISKVARENEISIDVLRSQIDAEIKKNINIRKKNGRLYVQNPYIMILLYRNPPEFPDKLKQKKVYLPIYLDFRIKWKQLCSLFLRSIL